MGVGITTGRASVQKEREKAYGCSTATRGLYPKEKEGSINSGPGGGQISQRGCEEPKAKLSWTGERNRGFAPPGEKNTQTWPWGEKFGS